MNKVVFSLPVLQEITPTISRRQVDESPVIVVEHPRVRAAVALQGAHLIAWQPEGEEPVVWLSDAAVFKPGTAIRGGIPVCWPWFGPAGSPAHGFARISDFELDSYAEDEQTVELAFRLRSDERTKALWPHDFELFIRFRLGQTCEVELEAHGDYGSTGALHSYFNVGDISGVAVSGLGDAYQDSVTGESGVQSGDVTFPDRTDRVYTEPASVSAIKDPALGRVIASHHRDNSDVVAWNPGPQLSKSMADLTDEGYREFVCVETARINRPMISAPDAPARLSTTITVQG